jgi:uncharacterized protein (DUF1778 family)
MLLGSGLFIVLVLSGWSSGQTEIVPPQAMLAEIFMLDRGKLLLYRQYVVSTPIRKYSSPGRRVASARVNLRIHPQVKAILVQAARLQRQRLTEFMVAAALNAAEIAVAERTRFVLSPRKWRQFNAALDLPPRQIPALRKLFSKPSVLKAA